MSTPVGVIKKFVKTLMTTKKTGSEALDEAFKAVGAIRYDVFKSKFISDRDSATYRYNEQDFIEQKCDIRLNNEDTGAITGSDVGGSKTKTAESIVPETAKAKKLTNAEYNSFTKNGLTVNITYAEKDDKDVDEKFNYSSATYLAKQKLVTRALYNWWIPESLDLINESLGINFTDGRAKINEIDINFVDSENNIRAVGVYCDYDLGFASKVTLTINSALLYNITENDKNGTLPEKIERSAFVSAPPVIYSDLYGGSYYQSAGFSNYLDRLILQAMAEITLKANVPDTKYTEEIGAGLVEIVGGYDDASTGYGLFVNSTSAKHYHGYGYMRYLAKNYSDGMPDGVSYNAKKATLTLTTSFTEGTIDLANFASTVKTVDASALKTKVKIVGNALANSIKGGSGNDTLNGEAGNDSIYGGAGTDYILGGAGNDKLYGQNGNDTLRGNAGNDTLTGGKGNDVFICGSGAEVITDYASGDKISLTAAVTKTSVSGSDVVFTLGKNSLTVKNAAGATLNLISSKGKSYSTVVGGGSTTLTVNNKTKSPVTVSSAVENIDASGRTSAVKITGNALDNVITGGTGNDSLYGGKGNDTLDGGKGNDKLWGDAGADTFLYFKGEGKDTIYGFDNNDMLLITGDFSATYSKNKKEVYFKVGNTSNAITLKQSTATSFNVNGFSYKVSGSKLARK